MGVNAFGVETRHHRMDSEPTESPNEDSSVPRVDQKVSQQWQIRK
jgi:hypothetical protein